MNAPPDILATILARKAEEVAARAARVPLAEVRAQSRAAPPPRDFYAALQSRIARGEPAVIAELKRASPSQGVLRTDWEPATIARSYERAGAAALSVLTERAFFHGDDAHLCAARAACALPVLRKDFICHPYQIYESRVLGADAVLLIVAALTDALLAELNDLARELGLAVLVEVHDGAELQRALALPGRLIGINNRDLKTFAVRLDTTLELRTQVPADRLLVAESGLRTPAEVARLRAHGVHAFLVGEAFMRAPDPGAQLAALFFT